MQINILVTLDRNYLLPLRVLLHALRSSDPDASYTVYVAHASLTQADFDRLRADDVDGRCVVVPVAVPEDLLDDAPILRRLSKATYYRLIAPSYLPREVDRILYLDPDVTVLRPLRELYNMDMDGRYFAAAGHFNGFVDFFNRGRLHIRHNETYINAGVLLMDVAALRALDNNEAIFDFVRRHAHTLPLGDQDTLNAFYDGKILTVDARRFNLDERLYGTLSRRGEIDLPWVGANTAIVHYAGRQKPWRPAYAGQLGVFFARAKKGLEASIGETI